MASNIWSTRLSPLAVDIMRASYCFVLVLPFKHSNIEISQTIINQRYSEIPEQKTKLERIKWKNALKILKDTNKSIGYFVATKPNKSVLSLIFIEFLTIHFIDVHFSISFYSQLIHLVDLINLKIAACRWNERRRGKTPRKMMNHRISITQISGLLNVSLIEDRAIKMHRNIRDVRFALLWYPLLLHNYFVCYQYCYSPFVAPPPSTTTTESQQLRSFSFYSSFGGNIDITVYCSLHQNHRPVHSHFKV